MFLIIRAKDILDELAKLTTSIHHWRYATMAALDNLKREVQETKTINASVIALLQGLKAKLDEALANDDQEAIQALADSLDVEQQGLAAAVSANTPQEPAPAPVPAEPEQPAPPPAEPVA